MEVSHIEFPMWDLSKTCFQVYGTKRKTTFSRDEEPHNQFCPVAKRACLPETESSSMEEDRVPEMSFAAITHQPSVHPAPRVLSRTPSRPTRQLSHHQQQQRQQQSQGGASNGWQAWRNGQSVDWKGAIRPSAGTESTPVAGCGAGADGDRVGAGMSDGASRTPRVEIDGDGDWQSQENLHKQLERQVHTPDLEQTRHERLRAKADKLKTQLQYMKTMDLESNDYWAVPQDNRLKMEDDLEQARIAMETDFVPDPYQYHCSDIPVPMAGHDSGSVNQVRCYCKPNWEGMLEPAAYI